MSEDRRQRWNLAHETKAEGPLSGSDAAEMLHHHGLEHYGLPDSTGTVLDIGVGLGQTSKYLRGCGYIVDALDVADKAEPTVRPWIRRFYLASFIDELPIGEYDLAISHLVAQHMAEPELRQQIKFVARSLAVGGVFSLHLAGSRIAGENNWPRDDIPDGFDGRMCRTESYALEMIKEIVGERYAVYLEGRPREWPEFRSHWYYVHVRRVR